MILISAAMVAVLAGTSAALACASYQVRPGDTLSKIARSELGSIELAGELYRLNATIIGGNPNTIEVGTILTLPCGGPQASAGSSVAASAVATLSPLTDTAGLEGAMAARRVQVVDIRPTDKLSNGVLPRTISLPFGAWRGPQENPGAPPDLADLAALIGAAGLRLDRPIVIASGSAAPMSMGRAAYVYWILKSVGARDIAVLDGGVARWQDEGREMGVALVRTRAYLPELTFDNTWRADTDDVQAIASGAAKGTLLDARPAGVFQRRSAQGQSLPSTLPGAGNSPVTATLKSMRQESDPVASVYEMLASLKAAPVNWESETVVSFCNTGELGALNWFFASEVAGIQNVKLFPESVVGWKGQGHALAAPGESAPTE
ncbi:MAG: rhodanese-like domain-containing protein [Pseudomonadota bacterium]